MKSIMHSTSTPGEAHLILAECAMQPENLARNKPTNNEHSTYHNANSESTTLLMERLAPRLP